MRVAVTNSPSTILPKSIGRDEPLHLLIDSTGLKIYGEGEWLDQKRGIRSPRRWRKLHLGVDADTHEVVAVELTQDDVGDVSELVGLLDQVVPRVASVIADGAYDGETVFEAVTDRHPQADIIIPPRASAVPSTSGATQRDQHIATIEKHVASAGSFVLATAGEASLRPRCIGTKPSQNGVYTLGFCPDSGSKQRLDATR
jgi:hypothetical protein